MKPKKIAKENATFFIIAVGMSFGMEHFARAVLDSSFEMALFPTDKTGILDTLKLTPPPSEEVASGKNSQIK